MEKPPENSRAAFQATFELSNEQELEKRIMKCAGNMRSRTDTIRRVLTFSFILLSTILISSAHADAASVGIEDITSYEWTGPDATSQFANGGLENLGDMNGDGIDDYVAADSSSTYRGAFVLYGPVNRKRAVDLSDISPSEGYRITASSITTPMAIGDHNGDGLDDIVLVAGGLFGNRIVYGVADPTTLAECDPGVVRTRCVNASSPVDKDGNRLGVRIQQGTTAFMPRWRKGDFSGTGETQTLLSRGANSHAYVLRGDLDSLCAAPTGACTLQFASLTEDNLVQFHGAASTSFGASFTSSEDLNGDGRSDLVVVNDSDGSVNPGIQVIYGKNWSESPIDVADLTESDGFYITSPFGSTLLVSSVGDVNGDGLGDFSVGYFTLIPQVVKLYIVYGRPTEQSTDLNLGSLSATQGYEVVPDSSVTFTSAPNSAPLGDLNGDGVGDFLVSNPDAEYESTVGAGAVTVVFGSRDSRTKPVVIGTNDVPDDSFTIVDESGVANSKMGLQVASAGDVDDDGLPDFVTSRAGAGNGSVLMVLGRTLVASAVTSAAGGVSSDSATLSGSARLLGRAATAYFEFGGDASYGQKSEEVSFAKSNRSVSVEAGVSGLKPASTYHYRLVVENDLGIKAFGADREFETTAVEVPRCEADPKAPGCPEYHHCEANPTDVICQTKPARLSNLIVGQKTVKVKRGKKGKVQATIVNTGDSAAKGLKLCVSGPKKFVAVPKCKKVGSLASGKSASATFKVKVKKKARRGKKIALKLKASANGLGAKNAKVNVKVR